MNLEIWLAAIESAEIPQHLRRARWSYAALNAAHILGIALLVGAAIPLGARMMGINRSITLADATRFLRPFVLLGLILALASGMLLFSVRATEYAALEVFWFKMALVACGLVSAVLFTARYRTERAAGGAVRFHAAISLISWIGALVCGRLIAFWSA